MSETVGGGLRHTGIEKLQRSEGGEPVQVGPLSAYVHNLPIPQIPLFLRRMRKFEQGTAMLLPQEGKIVEQMLVELNGDRQNNIAPKREATEQYILEELFSMRHINSQQRKYFSGLSDKLRGLSPLRIITFFTEYYTGDPISDFSDFLRFNGSSAWELQERVPIKETLPSKANYRPKTPPEINTTVQYDPSLAKTRYIVEENPTNSGGMSKIYRAWDSHLQKVVYIKELLNKKGVNEDITELEAKTMDRATHPNVPRIYDFTEQDGRKFMVMEYVKGESLFHRINTSKEKFTQDEVLLVVEQVGRLIDDMAKLVPPLFHKDLKPGNIILSKDYVKVIDFGIANWIEKDESDALQVTLGYSSPERLRGSKANLQSEVFSMAATTYSMLTNSVPFSGKDDSKTMVNTFEGKFMLPSKSSNLSFPCNTTVLHALDIVFQKAFQKNPKKRYQSGAEFYSAFSAALSDGKTEKAV